MFDAICIKTNKKFKLFELIWVRTVAEFQKGQSLLSSHVFLIKNKKKPYCWQHSHLRPLTLLLFSNPIFNFCPVLITTTNNLPNVIVLHTTLTQYNGLLWNPPLCRVVCRVNEQMHFIINWNAFTTLSCRRSSQKMSPYFITYISALSVVYVCMCVSVKGRKRIKCALLHILSPKGFPLKCSTLVQSPLRFGMKWWCDACSFILILYQWLWFSHSEKASQKNKRQKQLKQL